MPIKSPHLVSGISSQDRKLSFATWNILGLKCTTKREEVDKVLSSKDVDVCSLQEHKCLGEDFETSNYQFHLNCKKNKYLGLGFAIRKGTKYEQVETNVC